ncbi:DUF2637 domain-containing protein [Streptomyces sp. NPDC090442]|uniref:DUF2637 domain-containing protein n=1 Tax=Streptomyces sp. NPDC090442 TaxID=3365962 RepID=UPI00380624FA
MYAPLVNAVHAPMNHLSYHPTWSATHMPSTRTTARGTAAIRIGIALLGTIGFALSYDALRQMAIAIHVGGLLVYAFPLVIDGFIAIGVGALLILRTAPLRSRLYAWSLVGSATLTSIWANALHAIRLNQQARLYLDNLTVGALSAIAPLALAGAVHLYLVINRHLAAGGAVAEPPTARPVAVVAAPTPAPGHPARQEQPHHGSADGSAKAADEPAPKAKPAVAKAPELKATPSTGGRKPEGRKTTVPDDVLLATARAMRAQTGKVPRTVLEDTIRGKGYTIRKDLADEVAKAVMAEPASAIAITDAA